MKKKAFHLRFYLHKHKLFNEKGQGYTDNGWYVDQIEYKGDSIAECVVKAFGWTKGQREISSFTVRRGEGLGKNIKMVDYKASI